MFSTHSLDHKETRTIYCEVNILNTTTFGDTTFKDFKLYWDIEGKKPIDPEKDIDKINECFNHGFVVKNISSSAAINLMKKVPDGFPEELIPTFEKLFMGPNAQIVDSPLVLYPVACDMANGLPRFRVITAKTPGIRIVTFAYNHDYSTHKVVLNVSAQDVTTSSNQGKNVDQKEAGDLYKIWNWRNKNSAKWMEARYQQNEYVPVLSK